MRMPIVSDTHPDMERLQLDLMRQAPAWRKAQMLGEMYAAMKQLALSGLRSRYPDADERELQRRLADLLLPAALAERAYGPPPQGPSHVD
jgi:hypothetical protein